MAQALGISTHTVKDHIRGGCAKLGVDNRVQASRIVWQAQLTDPPGGFGVLPASAHPRGETRRGEGAVGSPARRRDLRLHPFPGRDERGGSAGDRSREDRRQTGL
ncbi:helix-turn-helix transcriptional regulator [Streptomyces parvulus]|uniref:helix-turn-helix transcriptional regulator n=1 Tax=Streptomyces parvulus TaxID=146923 RepID=UPI0033BA15D5